MSLKDNLKKPVDAVEEFFDDLELGYKWRFNRFKDLNLVPYRGYGTREELRLRGRVLDDELVETDDEDQSVLKNVKHNLERLATNDIPGARVRLSFQGRSWETETDGDGYFEFSFAPPDPLPEDITWHEVELELLSPDVSEQPDDREEVMSTGQILVPQPDCEFAIISDLDDTVIRTGATNFLRHARTVLLNSPHSRTPFAGVGTFYQALQRGQDGEGHNPIFYLSSSPYNFYGIFQEFFEAHDIPTGPILLKDFGFSDNKFIKDGHQEHKLGYIRELLNTYPDLSFVLIGDSGQKDPEVYRQIVEEHADRILTIYVRDVTPDGRDREVQKIAEAVREQGVPMMLVEDTITAAEHAAEEGLLTEEMVEKVRAAKAREEEPDDEGLLDKLS